MQESTEVLETALTWLEAGRKVALATVVETGGSSPRPVGSSLVVADDGAFEGSVSGGCVEGAVISAALVVIARGESKIMDFGYTDAEAWDVGLACGGSIKVFVERLDVDAARKALDSDGTRTIEADGERYRVQTLASKPRMLIVGAVHIAQSLIPMAVQIGYEIIVIDPRNAFANPERFPNIRIDNRSPDEAMSDLKLDDRTAVVVLSHDPKIDEPALQAAMDSNVFYIGVLGSKGNHAKRLERLAELGYSKEQLSRVHGPIGLPLGGRSPPEIAVSILAQVVQSRNQPIHSK
jgi:xanthine dehydrogenase accessory factor